MFGGGIGGGALDGSLVVFVIDALTSTPVSGAEARIDDARVAVTDERGAVIFDDVVGPVDLTIEHETYARASWLGVDGARVTVPMDLRVAAPPPQGSIEATIEGWESMTAPDGQYLLAVAGYTRSLDLDAPERLLEASEGTTCIATMPGTPCTLTFAAVAGRTAVFAVIAHGDPGTTPDDRSDDILTPVGFAFAGDVVVPPGGSVSGLELASVDDLISIVIGRVTLPSGLSSVVGVPGINLSPNGVLVFPDLGSGIFLGPNVTREFADRTYWAIGVARDEANGQSWSVARNLVTSPPESTPTLEIPSPLPAPVLSEATPGALSIVAPGSVRRYRAMSPGGELVENGLIVDARPVVRLASDPATAPTVQVEAIETSEHLPDALQLSTLDTAPARWSIAELRR
jgi:hypothetical protein